MSKLSLDRFLALLERSKLVEGQTLAAAVEDWKRRATLAELDDATPCAEYLIDIGLLTRWQARKRRSELERELAAYSTPAQRCDLEATLDRYPDDITYELREILASQAMAAYNNRIPGAGRY